MKLSLLLISSVLLIGGSASAQVRPKTKAVVKRTSAAHPAHKAKPVVYRKPAAKGKALVKHKLPAKKASAPAKDQIYRYVEVQPVFPGNLSAWMSEHLNYPEEDRDAGNEGKVYIQFIVDYEGNVTEPSVVKSSGHNGLDAEALKVVSQMPRWKPATNNGQVIKCYFALPVVFALE